jgi:hypothetical protein
MFQGVDGTDRDGSRVRPDQGRDYLDERRLPGAVRPHQAGDLTRGDLQRELVKRPAMVIRFHQSLGR